jgi:hypothetical protein
MDVIEIGYEGMDCIQLTHSHVVEFCSQRVTFSTVSHLRNRHNFLVLL